MILYVLSKVKNGWRKLKAKVRNKWFLMGMSVGIPMWIAFGIFVGLGIKSIYPI